MTIQHTADQVIGHIYSYKGGMISAPGNPYGSQCVALVQNAIDFMGLEIPRANAIDLLTNSAIVNSPDYDVYLVGQTTPQRGDFIVYDVYYGYGHVELVTDFRGDYIETLGANLIGNLDEGGPVEHISRVMDGTQADGMPIAGYIRPHYVTTETGKSNQPQLLKNEQGTMRVTVDVLNVRNQPSVSGEIVAQYQRGMTLNYDSVYLSSGYVWVSYVSTSGVRRYVAAGKELNGRRDPSETYGDFY